MSVSQQIEAVYQRAIALRDRATERPTEPDLLEAALKELYFVLEELHTADDELNRQNQALSASQFELTAERQRYQTLFELAPDGYLVTDQQGKIYHANRAASRLLAVDQNRLVGKPLVVLIDPHDRSQLQQRLHRPLASTPWEITLTARQAAPLTLAIATTHLHDSRGQATTILWSLRDITQRYQMEQALQAAHTDLEHQVALRTAELVEANEQLQQEIEENRQAEHTIRYQSHLIDVATDAIYVLDPHQHITFWNRGAETLYGWTATEVLGKNVEALLGESDALADPQTTVEAGGWQSETNHQRKDGQRVTVLSRHSRVNSATDGPTSVLVVDTDITEKKQLEAEFLQTQRLESLGVLARGIAHDLKNILMPVSIVPQLLLKELPDANATTRELLESLKRAAQRGTALAQQILAFASQPQGKPTQLRVEDLIQEVQAFAHHAFPQSIAIEVHSEADLKPVCADATLLYQVLLNLCVNARDAMPNGGTLTISAQNAHLQDRPEGSPEAGPGDYIAITIADTGTGIAPDILDRVFDPLFTTKPEGQGSGLGLSTVAKIVKDYRGFVRVVSEVGSGCQFQVYLPAARASAPSSAAD
ncbi:hypothetical protein C8255_12645 [filamentous cyanobacterium CCP3]|nr:hypothetical protein C8255_12645 [filamentous cyanobacterium CCP3]